MKKKTSEAWKNARCRPERLKELNTVCRGMEIVLWETERVMRHVTHDEALAILLQCDAAKKFAQKAKENAKPDP